MKLTVFKNLVIAVLTSSVLCACTTNKITGRQQLLLVTERGAISQSAVAYQSMIGDYERSNKISDDKLLVRRVTDITNRLIDQAVRYRQESADWTWELVVINEDKINAFCMAGGKMAIYHGIVERLDLTDDEIAMVMGHEIAHALAGHAAEKMSIDMAAKIGVAVIVASAGNNNKERRAYEQVAGYAALTLISLPNSRDAETEADRLGIEFATRAGYDPSAGVSLWQKMAIASGNTDKSDFLSTHPSPGKREEALNNLAQKMRDLDVIKPDFSTNPNPWIVRDFNNHIAFSPASYVASNEALRIVSMPNDSTSSYHLDSAVIKNDQKVSKGISLEGAAMQMSVPKSVNLIGDKSRVELSEKIYHAADSDEFKNGLIRLECEGACRSTVQSITAEAERFSATQRWHELIDVIVRSGIRTDLSYYYLAKAARELDYQVAAMTYYNIAIELSKDNRFACKNAIYFNCRGIDIQMESSAALRIINATRGRAVQ